ncbi:MAG: FAD-binding protein [Candidatus Nanopelagicales bacterium]
MTSALEQEAAPFAALSTELSGDLFTPDDVGWDRARTAWNLAVDQRPTAVAEVADVADVVSVIRFAAAHGLHVAAQGTGHQASTLGPRLADTILIRTHRMRGLRIDPEARTAWAEAGVLWGEVSAAAGEHQLLALAGSAADVGVVGYTLGGGLSWLARKYGLAANAVVAAEIVTATGEVLRVDDNERPELLWALRGGGGSVVVVTALEIRLFEHATVVAGALFWPLERSVDVVAAWEQWTRDLDEDVTACIRLLQFPPLPDIPEPMRGNSFVVVEVVHAGDESDAQATVAPLRELGPVMDTIATIPAPALAHLHMDPPGPVPGVGDGFVLDDLPAAAQSALLTTAGPGSGSPLLSVELRTLGGALSRPAPGGGAMSSVPGRFLVYAVGIAPDPASQGAVRAQIDLVQEALSAWANPRSCMGFTEHEVDSGNFFADTDLARLRAAKAAHDPDGRIRTGHLVTLLP